LPRVWGQTKEGGGEGNKSKPVKQLDRG